MWKIEFKLEEYVSYKNKRNNEKEKEKPIVWRWKKMTNKKHYAFNTLNNNHIIKIIKIEILAITPNNYLYSPKAINCTI